MKKMLIATVAGLSLLLSSNVWSYDDEMAKSYDKLFSICSGSIVGKNLNLIKPEGLVKDLMAGKEIVILDVRTPEETDLVKVALPNSLTIPVDQVFKSENLAKIPTDKPVVVMCKGGGHSIAVGTALRHIGFHNVYMLMGGIAGLTKYYGPAQAYPKEKKVAAN